MARILGIGTATLDVINTVDGYPPEDAEVRALARRIVRGGNATNTLVVLSQLGHHCAWAGTLPDGPDAEPVLADLRRFAVDTGPCRRTQGALPVSYVTLNARNGSRTIVHYRNLPEFGADQFRLIDVDGYDWVHFEGRNVPETGIMLQALAARAPRPAVSLEVEKPRAGIEALFGHADLVLFSRQYARARGFATPGDFLAAMAESTSKSDLVCTWGEEGAAVLSAEGRLFNGAAYPPPRLVDTLGAGDTFNAGVIDARLRGSAWDETLEAAGRLAGRKCGQSGFDDLAPRNEPVC
ncbi:MAG: PfkB family carbohydrate kinase [Gammaproteobacteria bacterium]